MITVSMAPEACGRLRARFGIAVSVHGGSSSDGWTLLSGKRHRYENSRSRS
jgi:hypothetical protein